MYGVTIATTEAKKKREQDLKAKKDAVAIKEEM